MESKIGTWKANGTHFTNKINALVEASRTNTNITYHYYDDSFHRVNRELLGKTTLPSLYRERAQQIRDEYDYLILYYSGGADSWNVLNTFLKNNIKLDCIYVRWPMKANEYHNFNTHDTSAYNFMSEWKYVIEPDLKWLAQHHPEIKIIVDDWSTICKPSYYNDKRFELNNHMHSASSLIRIQTFSDYEISLVDKGYKVAEIWGIDKPMLAHKNNKLYLSFRDAAICTGTPYWGNTDGVEYFYWTPKMPNLVFEQSYAVLQYLRVNPHLLDVLLSPQNSQITEESRCLYKTLLYQDWDETKFQTDKPISMTREDKDYWIYKFSDFNEGIDSWRYIYNSELSNVDERFCRVGPDGKKLGIKLCLSLWHYVGDLI